jgi:hypothetical protein
LNTAVYYYYYYYYYYLLSWMANYVYPLHKRMLTYHTMISCRNTSKFKLSSQHGKFCRSQWLCRLRRVSTVAGLLRLPVVWMTVSCDRCVLSHRGHCDRPITRPEDSYRMRCILAWSKIKSWGGDREVYHLRKSNYILHNSLAHRLPLPPPYVVLHEWPCRQWSLATVIKAYFQKGY